MLLLSSFKRLAIRLPFLPLLPLPLPLQAEQAIRADYRCLGRFDAMDVTALFFNQAMAASGSRYAAADQEFWIKGDEASWRLGAAPPMGCGPLPSSGR